VGSVWYDGNGGVIFRPDYFTSLAFSFNFRGAGGV
jgi:hypothetical protein